MSWRDYERIPYREKGREMDGADCWGLVRLWYQREQGIDLPSLAEGYEASDSERIAETIAREKEHWIPVDRPQSGDVVVFRLVGLEQHVGLFVKPGWFLHVQRGGESVQERLDAPMWRHRIEGFYRYASDGAASSIMARPHPLKTIAIDFDIPHGASLLQIADEVRRRGKVDVSIPDAAIIAVDGEYIPRSAWGNTVPARGARIEYRAVPGDDGEKLIGTLAVAAFAWYAAPALAGAGAFGSAGWTALGTNTFAAAMISAGINMAGGMLLNSIFPTRPPKINNPGTATAMSMFSGGANQANPYGAIPVVLGRVRFTPPLAVNTYFESSGSVQHMRMALLVGYGPLEKSNMTIGETPLVEFEDVEHASLSGTVGEDTEAFDKLCGQDVAQEVVNVKLDCVQLNTVSASRSANVVTVETSVDHTRAVGDFIKLYAQEVVTTITDGGYDMFALDGSLLVEETTGTVLKVAASGFVTEIVSDTVFKFGHAGADGAIADHSYILGSTPVTRVLSDVSDRVTITLYFPAGLRKMPTAGKEAGKIDATEFRGILRWRQLDADTLAPLTAWADVNKAFAAKTFSLSSAWYNIDDDAALEEVYRWARISVTESNIVKIRYGAYTENPAADPSGALLTRLQAENYGLTVPQTRLPLLPDGEEELWQVCVKGNAIHSTVDVRASGVVTGGGLTSTGRTVTIAAGSIARAKAENVRIGAAGDEFYKQKDAFSYNFSFDVPSGPVEVQVMRTNDAANEFTYPSGNAGMRYHDAYFYAVTGYENRRPINFEHPLAMDALRLKSTDQFNGQVDGIKVTAQSICLDWDYTTEAWIERPTRNPASLYRYVLQHPANAKPTPDARIALDDFIEWHDFCRTNGFTFDNVYLAQDPLEEVLRDIAAAGRASPCNRDDKRSIVIDRVADHYAPALTPRNSWGFEGSRTLPDLPHGWRVQFINADRGFQPDERTVYRDGYNESNATLLEGLELPGVTSPALVHKHGRMHFANLSAQAGEYKIYAGREGFLYRRGDLVPVQHHVPRFGIGSARIKARIDGTHIEVDDDFPMVSGTAYMVLIRLADGSSITRTVTEVETDGDYNIIGLPGGVSETEGAAGNLVLFGTLGNAYAELVVQHIERINSEQALITFRDYAPARFDSDTETIPAFDSHITGPAGDLKEVISVSPTITRMVSDESVMTRLAPGSYRYAIRADITAPTSLPKHARYLQAQIDYAEDNLPSWGGDILQDAGVHSVTFHDVQEGAKYRIRVRYIANNGRVGPWAVSSVHTVVGRTNPPAQPASLSITVSGNRYAVAWPAAPEIDVIRSEIRTEDANWGENDAGRVYYGGSTSCFFTPSAIGDYTLYLRYWDDIGNKSAARSASVTYSRPGTVPEPTQDVTNTINGKSTVVLDWDDTGVAGSFALGGFEIRSSNTGWGTAGYLYKGAASKAVLSNVSTTTTSTWYIKAFDVRGKYSSTARQVVHDAVLPPNILSFSMVRQKGNLVMTAYPLSMPADFAYYEFRLGKTGGTSGDDTPDAVPSTGDPWNDQDCVVIQSVDPVASVALTRFPTPRYTAEGITYRAACRMVDKSGNKSATSAIATTTIRKLA